MKSKILAGLGTLGLSLTAIVAGCGDDTTDGGGSGGSDTTTTATVTTGVTAQSVTATTAATGGTGDGNDSFAEADALEEAMGVPGISENDAELNPPDTDVDYYTFNGLAGLASIRATSKPTGDPFSNLDPDIVLSLYDSTQALIATNDDPYPRTTQDSAILTVLPADGLYYLKVEEFCATPNAGCNAEYFDTLEDLSYSLQVLMEGADVIANPKGEVEPNDTVAQATNGDPLETMPGSAEYYLTLGYGEFNSMTDVEYISFTMPDNIVVDPGTEVETFFTFQPPGKTLGSGSSRFTGSVRIEDGMGNIVALQDWANESDAVDFPDLSVPLTGGVEYFIRVQGGPNEADGPLAPFFVYANAFSQSNPLELAELTNNLQATPEVLSHPMGNTTGYFVSGHLGTADVDHFSIATDGNTALTVVCASGRLGSGVQALQAEVIAGSDGMVLDAGTETGDAELLIGGDMMPIDVTGETTVIVRMEASGGQNPLVSADHYRCGYGFGMLP